MKIFNVTKPLIISHDCSFENTYFVIDCDVGIIIESCVANFTSCQFKGNNKSRLIVGSGASLIFKDCAMHDSLIAINLSHSKAKIHNCLIENIYENFISANKSKINITDSKISHLNAELSSAFIYIDNSNLNIMRADIFDGSNATAIYAKNSNINLNNMDIFNNQESALYFENSQFFLMSIKIYKNGSFEKDFSQVYCENSKGVLDKSFIFNGVDSNAIKVTKTSNIKILNSSIFKNNLGIYLDRFSSATVYNCKIFSNAYESEEGIQIWVDNAKIAIIQTKIFDNHFVSAIYAQKDAYVFLNNCKIYNNKFGIKAYDLAKFKIKNSFLANIESIVFDNAYVLLENTIMSTSKCRN